MPFPFVLHNENMNRRPGAWALSAFTLLVGLLFLYQNCGGGLAVAPLDRQIVQTKVAEALELADSDRGALCGSLEQYDCYVKSFRPDGVYSESIEKFCLNDGKCLNLKKFTYDTSEALKNCPDCTPTDGEWGGRYHYDEVRCFHRAFQSGMEMGVLAEGNEASQVVSLAVNQCLALLKVQ